MDQRIIKYYAGELSSDERKSLLDEVFSNKTLKREMMDFHNMNYLMKLHPEKKDEIAGKKSLDRFKKARRREKGRRLFLRVFLNVAVILACVVFTWYFTKSSDSVDAPYAVTQKLTVPAGQRAHIQLADGTTVWVNAGSTLTYPTMFGKERRVSLTGEAFFDVAKGEAPFIVSTGKTDVRALGTQFNVFNYPAEKLVVSLLEGLVKVYPMGNEQKGVFLTPNQQLTDDDGRFAVTSIATDPIAWKEGLYVFEYQQMKDILKKLELYYDVKFTVQYTPLLNYRYTGMFRQRDGVMEILRIIQKIHPFKIKQVENTNEIILYR